jgi:hypothetical protein
MGAAGSYEALTTPIRGHCVITQIPLSNIDGYILGIDIKRKRIFCNNLKQNDYRMYHVM